MVTEYNVHPSGELVSIFRQKPYQGQDPERAKVIILGNDANYSPEISAHPFFKRVIEYHADGVVFWRRTTKHHPFLLDDYPLDKREGGRPYHLKFSKMGFGPEDADAFSFVELLNVPTIGNTTTNREVYYQLMDANHLQWIEDLIFRNSPRFVLASKGLVKRMSIINNRFGRLGRLLRAVGGASRPVTRINGGKSIVYCGYNFSASHATDHYLAGLSREIRAFLGANPE